MTAKKRARNRSKKAGAAAAAATAQAAERRPPMPNVATREPLGQEGLQMHQLQTDDSPPMKYDIKDKDDICVHMHGPLLQHTNEKLKETIMRLCDDVVSADFADIQKVFVGTVSEFDLEGHHPLNTLLDDRLNIFSSLFDQEVINADDVPDDKGILFTLLFKHPESAEDPIHIEWVVSHFLSEGTQCMLRGHVQAARGHAFFACCFEQIMGVVTGGGKMLNLSKVLKLYNADEHTLCSFFRNRIPCSCLNKKYKEVKSLTKKDVCWNIDCNQPDRFDVDNKSIMCCSRCRQASYCCRECQEIDWPKHKINCGFARDMGAILGEQNIDELENNKVWARSFAPLFSQEIQQLKKAGINVNPFKAC